MSKVTISKGEGYTRYLSMPGFYESWTYEDGRRPAYAKQCVPVTPQDLPSGVLVDLWTAMNQEAGFTPTETDRTIWTKEIDRTVWP